MRFRVPIIKLGLTLVVGLMLSLSIAWLGAATSQYRSAPSVHREGVRNALTMRDSVTWRALLSEYVQSYRRDLYATPLPSLAAPQWWLPFDWSVGRRGLTDELLILEEGHGFPLRCLCSRRDEQGRSLYRWGIVISKDFRAVPRCVPPDFELKGTIHITERSLPLMPIQLGLALDTLFWGAALATAYRGARWGIAANRRRRGRCAYCKYPRPAGPAVCPECGKPWNGRLVCRSAIGVTRADNTKCGSRCSRR